jgi:hypothetical protein
MKMNELKLSILVASCGRESLGRTIESIRPQLEAGDELIVDVNDDAPWGHHARNRMMVRAKGDMLLFIDDDDIYLPHAFQMIRLHAEPEPDRVHIFQMQYPDGRKIWRYRTLIDGNVSTQMFCVPNRRLGQWGTRYAGDFDFITQTCELQGPPAWHQVVIVEYCHDPNFRGGPWIR